MRVFTDLEVAAKAIPSTANFLQLKQLVRQAITDCSGTLSAVFLGSAIAPEKRIKCTSDLDVFWTVDDHLNPAVAQTKKQILAEANALHIPTELVMLDRCEMRTPYHNARPGFRSHIVLCMEMGGMICGDPIRRLTPNFMTLEQELGGYLGLKYQKQTKYYQALPLPHATTCEMLANILSAPDHIARKMMQLKQPKMMRDHSAETARATYSSIFPGAPSQGLKRLTGYRAQYHQLLEESLQGKFNSKRYQKAVEELAQQSIAVSIQFIRNNLELI